MALNKKSFPLLHPNYSQKIKCFRLFLLIARSMQNSILTIFASYELPMQRNFRDISFFCWLLSNSIPLAIIVIKFALSAPLQSVDQASMNSIDMVFPLSIVDFFLSSPCVRNHAFFVLLSPALLELFGTQVYAFFFFQMVGGVVFLLVIEFYNFFFLRPY